MYDKLLIIGISGVTCSGKTTLARKLKEVLPNSKMISQDDYFLDVGDPRHIRISDLNHINFDVLSSLDMDKMHADIEKLTENKVILKNFNTSKKDESFIDENQLFEFIIKMGIQILIIEGFLIFNCKVLVPLCDLKYYLTLDREECRQRRSKRNYDPPDCPGYFENCVWPEHLKHFEEIRKTVSGVKYFDSHAQEPLRIILSDVTSLLQKNY